jgi:hypothetical protein
VLNEYQAIEADPTIDEDFAECTAILINLCEERPTRQRMESKFDTLDESLYFIRCGVICIYFGTVFDPTDRVINAEIVRITRCSRAKASQKDTNIARARNELFQQALLP